MVNKKTGKNRKPKEANLKGLKITDSKTAYRKTASGIHRLKSNVYGILDKDTHFIYRKRNKRNGKVERYFINDVHKLPGKIKTDIMNFFDNPKNKRNRKVYLVD